MRTVHLLIIVPDFAFVVLLGTIPELSPGTAAPIPLAPHSATSFRSLSLRLGPRQGVPVLIFTIILTVIYIFIFITASIAHSAQTSST